MNDGAAAAPLYRMPCQSMAWCGSHAILTLPRSGGWLPCSGASWPSCDYQAATQQVVEVCTLLVKVVRQAQLPRLADLAA